MASSRSSRGVRLLALLLVSIFFSTMIDPTEGLSCYHCGTRYDVYGRSGDGGNSSSFLSDAVVERQASPSFDSPRVPFCSDGPGESVLCPSSSSKTCVTVTKKGTMRGCGTEASGGGCRRENGLQICNCYGDNCNGGVGGGGCQCGGGGGSSGSGGNRNSTSGGESESSLASSMSLIGGIFIFIISTMVASISASTTGGF